jgi:hypothetical protein
MDGSLAQDLARPEKLIVMVTIVETLPDWLAYDLTTTIMLGELVIVNILQGGFVFHCNDLFEIRMDDLFLRRVNLAKLLGKFGPDTTGPSIENVEIVLLETFLKIFNKNLALLAVALELRGNESRGLLRSVNFDWTRIFMDDRAKGGSVF